MRSVFLLALVGLVLAQPWAHPGFSATYHQTVKNTGLLALRGKSLDIYVTYEVIRVNGTKVTFRIYGNATIVTTKSTTKTINTTITVNPNWKNVSLPFLTESKFKELLEKAPHNCTGDICTFTLNLTQSLPGHNMLIVFKGYEKIDKNLLILQEAELTTKVYMVKGTTKRLIGTSVSTIELLKYKK
ncbi:hypothetical protein IPA_00525 [Ignicoccus pacificus DSM 13166]|uniref:Uncharacterized protein n=1 Tax=Ignicoccus pacificus DSM 13166 TaxID=940294 RepID=A0A977KAC5_9CREN|nr:hypothetical protein IPA_00525 [Ignicoccus pacificus DSM 13166]